jgi:hypothetical protein
MSNLRPSSLVWHFQLFMLPVNVVWEFANTRRICCWGTCTRARARARAHTHAHVHTHTHAHAHTRTHAHTQSLCYCKVRCLPGPSSWFVLCHNLLQTLKRNIPYKFIFCIRLIVEAVNTVKCSIQLKYVSFVYLSETRKKNTAERLCSYT